MIFRVLRSTTPGGPYTTVARGVRGGQFRDNTVDANTTYYYVVQKDRDLQGPEQRSSEVEVVVPPGTGGHIWRTIPGNWATQTATWGTV